MFCIMWPILGSELSVVAFFNKISVIFFRKVGIYFETKKSVFVEQDRTDLQEIFCTGRPREGDSKDQEKENDYFAETTRT